MRYREVIHTPLWLLALIYFFFLSLVLSVWAALGNNAALLTLIATTLLLILIYFKTALTLQVSDEELIVGRARIEHQFIGQINLLNNKEVGVIRTRDADPAAFLAIRFWSPKAIQVMIEDPRDVTPYWLISTKKGEEIKRALKN